MSVSPSSHVTARNRAFVIFEEVLGVQETRLGRVLTFFGVPWQPVALADVAETISPYSKGTHTILSSADVLAMALTLPSAAPIVTSAFAVYTYASTDREVTRRAVSALTHREWVSTPALKDPVSVEISDLCREVTGPMSGLCTAIAATPDASVCAPSEGPHQDISAIMSANGVPAFFRTQRHGVPIYVCVTGPVVDIDAPVGLNYYDVKSHFLSAVPLVMFITWAFRGVMWRPQELGACLIIDDPLLKTRYGFCNFVRLRDLMREHRFTTNIAFIPWNWRRTTRRASEFFRREADLFSVSVHGCDHVAAEFGTTSLDLIGARARLAQARMGKHVVRTQIQHDPIMVFPQGVFSSHCPAVLKQTGFVAAVNTEIAPVDLAGATTLVRDVWDTAILRYGSFAIYTRRYPHHGVENFAFDLLLGKPCFIVTHHEYFRDGGDALVALIEQLRALNAPLHWRSPREVVRRAYRRRADQELTRVQMYGTEILLANPHDRASEFEIHKLESDASTIEDITQQGQPIAWSDTSDGLRFRCLLPPGKSVLVKLAYGGKAGEPRVRVSMKYELSVAARRILSEMRDEYVQKLYSRKTSLPVPQRAKTAVSEASHA